MIAINRVGDFNMIRLGADAMYKNESEPNGERGVQISIASVAAFDRAIRLAPMWPAGS